MTDRLTEEFLSLTDSAARRVAEMISSGSFRPGDRLPSERELAATLGISRGALREALRTLESVGLLQARVGSGRYVTAVSAGDPAGGLSVWMQLQPVGDVVSVRRILEPAAIMAIPATRLDATAAEARAVLDRMSRAFDRGKLTLATHTHTEFHLALVQYAPSRLHRVLLASMIKAVESAQLEIFRNRAAGAQSLAKHVPMVEALEAGDVEGAGALVAEHLTPAFAYALEEES
jgi:GntR family transcriptional regulator, transcriptional repressor for pyruvate dehydrogenase complex